MLEWRTDNDVVMLVCGMDDLPYDLRGDAGLRFAESGARCRDMARDLPIGAEVMIGEDLGDVAPLNLAAAIKHDRGDVRVNVVASSRGGSMASRASSAGVELLVSPAEARDRVRSHGVMTQSAPQGFAGGESRSMAVSLVSGRGGVGKSTLCVLLAMASHMAGFRTALVDMDMQFGDLSYLCANDDLFEKIPLEEMNTIWDFAGVPDDAISLFHVDTLPEYAEESDCCVGKFLRDAKTEFDAIFVNTGTHWTDSHADIMDACDAVMFVMDQRPASVVSCREAMELASRLGMPSSKFNFLVNRCNPREQISGYDCALALGVDNVLQVLDGGREIEDAFALGMPSSLRGARNPAVESSSLVARELLSRFGFVVDAPMAGAGSRVLWRRGGRARRGE